ncbi:PLASMODESMATA CALLOSE-BINDING PROTEIN 1 isoform X2 [Nicotiana sylvestris]|uniref:PLASMODESMATA CALLOSE-BINDING PROTEIN 1 isoform X2 n=1 Tax=Nicotiana sylvestris TaxID=4096 RepID=A0A1U7XG42_NICSY|nr:PREDICTED: PLASMODESMATA CALLOSE-BINDING PROTEIN 1 isoform X2 [Nicotiana sylvestris]
MRVSCCFLFCLLIFSGTSFADKPSTKAIRKSKKLAFQEEDITISPSMFSAQQDVPIINPTTPGTTNPNPNPNPNPPTMDIPPPSTTDPFTNPGPFTNPNPSPNTNPNPNPPMNPNPNPTPNTNPNPNPNPNPTNNPGPSTGSWCIASPSASPTALQVALDYACGFGGADCATIQSGASCYEPNTLKDHASYAFNDYYQKNPVPTSCDFGGTAQLTNTDPSSGSCHYASSKTTPTTPPAQPPPTLPPPSPSTMTPVNPYTPVGQNGSGSEPTDYGLEPTGTPNGADNLSSNIQLLFSMASFMVAITITHF